MTRNPLSAAILGLLLALPGFGCSHSEAFGTGVERVTAPFSTTPPVRLTYNVANNYWPTWTEDGRGIIYSYSYPLPDSHADDRCLGLLPPTGGARIWQLCDERREHADSADSFAAAAIGTDGRLIYLEISSRRGPGGLSGVNPPPRTTVLWLADTAFPFQRRKLLDLSSGVRLADTFVNWLRDTHWSDPTSFVSLAQFDYIRPNQQPGSALVDSIFIGVGVVRGEISASGAVLSLVPGTFGATTYSVAENGASLVFVRSGAAIERVPAAGGSPTTVATLPGNVLATGVTCQGTTCLVTTGRPGTAQSIYRVMLATGEAIPFAIPITDSPGLPPTGGTLVGRNGRSLYLFTGLLP